MKLAKIAMGLTALVATSFSVAGGLKASSSVDILAFDGVEVKKNATLQINDNKPHQVVVSVSQLIDNSYFSTDPIVLTFNGSNEDTLIFVPDFNSKFEAEKYRSKPTFQIKTASGKVLEHKQDYLKGEGFAPNSRIEDNLAKYNASKAIAAVPPFTNATWEKNDRIVVQTSNVTEEQLQLLFKKADKATQKRFLEWAKKQ
ncbi:hypothetical protein B0187_02275 [Haemophilus paracuniculus]|uniref:Uncharacterized protein n=1 Tax=Haemophilus paracuniculus TaxID=734 RepID=A0A1T0AVM3_9PAST|nr:DUF2057 family protein [Haemophilus paracuniculus]OOS00333.1 hypothetical protein B0187_02275 [Haemophilus paracuniculus]